jgi:hypothetical protein
MTDADCQERTIRQLRLRIGRLRRGIDRRVRAVQREGGRLTSWRTYVERYPGQAVLAALGLGLAVSSGMRRVRWTRLIGWHLVRRSLHAVVSLLREEWRKVWVASGAESTRRRGGDDGRA